MLVTSILIDVEATSNRSRADLRSQVDLDFILNRHRIHLESVQNRSCSGSVEVEVEASVGVVEVAD